MLSPGNREIVLQLNVVVCFFFFFKGLGEKIINRKKKSLRKSLRREVAEAVARGGAARGQRRDGGRPPGAGVAPDIAGFGGRGTSPVRASSPPTRALLGYLSKSLIVCIWEEDVRPREGIPPRGQGSAPRGGDAGGPPRGQEAKVMKLQGVAGGRRLGALRVPSRCGLVAMGTPGLRLRLRRCWVHTPSLPLRPEPLGGSAGTFSAL